MKDLLSELFRDDEIPCICIYCEHCIKVELTDSYICKRGKLKLVSDTDSCKKFSPDLLKLEPKPVRKYRPETDILL